MKGSREDLLHRASTSPAMVSVPGWAAELAAIDLADFMLQVDRPSIFAQLSALGTRLESANASVVAPTIPVTPAGAWIGEAQPIPANQSVLTNVVLAPRKAGLLAAYTNELRDLSLPSIESVPIETLLSENLRRLLDTTLIDTLPASAVRPAGLRNGVTALVPSTNTSPELAMVADIKAIVNAVLAAGGSQVVLLLSPSQSVGFLAMVPALGYPSS